MKHLPWGRLLLTSAVLSLFSLTAFAQNLNKPDFDSFLQARPAQKNQQLTSALKKYVHNRDLLQMEERINVPTMMWVHGRPDASLVNQSVEDVARNYLSRYGDAYGYSRDTFTSAKLKYVHDLGRGSVIAKFEQEIGGIPVHHAQTNVVMDQSLNLIAITGYLFPHDQSLISPNWEISEQQAVSIAYQDLVERPLEPGDLDALRTDAAGFNLYDISPTSRSAADGFSDPARIKQVYYANADTFIPAYSLEINVAVPNTTDSVLYSYAVSAVDGSLLSRVSLTDFESYTYRVWADSPEEGSEPWDGPQGNAATPHPTGTPDGHQETLVGGQLRTLQNLPFSNNDPWLPDSAAETNGNNVDAYIDRFGDDGYSPGSGDFRAQTTSANTFDYSFDHGQSPTILESQNAAVTQLFYVCNYLHDDYYDAGFDEAAGNAQDNNFGRGGVAGDRMRSEAQDGTSTNNANMSTPSDGARPRMQMYIFDWATPDRDGTIDNGISGHEWGHYYHRRLVNAGNSQSSAMGEGWGDIIALLMSVDEGDDLDGTFATGGYATFQIFGIGAQNLYFGIRRYPYSVDQSKNPLHLGHIDPDTALPTNAQVPISPAGWQNNGNAEVHNAGEVWCQMVWECYRDLLADRLQNRGNTFDEIKNLMQEYLTTSLKLSPSSPTFTEARDALLLAAAANSDADLEIFAAAFARRGAGNGAVSPDRGSSDFTGTQESFEPIIIRALDAVSAQADDSIDNCDSDNILDEGETGMLTVFIRNTGFGSVAGTTATVTTSDDVSFPNGNTLTIPSSVGGGSTQAQIQVALNTAPVNGEVTFTVTFSTAQGIGANPTNITVPVNIDSNVAVDEDFEGAHNFTTNLIGGTLDWSLVEDGNATSGTHAFFFPDIASANEAALETPQINVPTGEDLWLTFNHRFSFEPGWDGGVIEVSADGQNWTDINNFVDPGYTNTIDGQAGTSIANLPAYTGNNGFYPDFERVSLNLGENFAGQTIQFRFKGVDDSFVGALGWWIDDVAVYSTVPEPEPCVSCFASEEDAITEMLVRAANWPDYSMLNLVDTLNQVCEP